MRVCIVIERVQAFSSVIVIYEVDSVSTIPDAWNVRQGQGRDPPSVVNDLKDQASDPNSSLCKGAVTRYIESITVQSQDMGVENPLSGGNDQQAAEQKRKDEEAARQQQAAEQKRKVKDAARQQLANEQKRKVEEVAGQQLAEEQTREDEEAARQQQAEEQTTKDEEAARQQKAAEQTRKDEEARQQHAQEQKQKEEEAVQQQQAEEQKRKVEEVAGQQQANKQKRKDEEVALQQHAQERFADWPRAPVTSLNFGSPVKPPTAPSAWNRPAALGNSKIAASKRQSSSGELSLGMLHNGPALTAEQKHTKLLAEANAFSDKVGKVEVWRIDDFDMVPVEPELYGQFYSGDSYIIRLSHDSRGENASVIYFWLGRHSSEDEIGTAALKAAELGAPVLVRVTQNKEPLHMLRLFQGKFVVHQGGHPSSFHNVSKKVTVSDGTGLYHIQGTNEFDTRAVQVEKTAAHLNSSDAFVLCEKDKVLVWFGKHASEDEKEDARRIAKVLCGKRTFNEVEEGSETDEFWAELGGKCEYPEGAPKEDEATAARLFHCSNASGAFEVEEIHDFSQDDLQTDDVYILDVWSQLFAWVGNEANEMEKRGVMDLCAAYMKSSNREGIPIIQLSAGAEPPTFTCHFLGWETFEEKTFEDPYEAKMKTLKNKGSVGSSSIAIEFLDIPPDTGAVVPALQESDVPPVLSATHSSTNSLSGDEDAGVLLTSPAESDTAPTAKDATVNVMKFSQLKACGSGVLPAVQPNDLLERQQLAAEQKRKGEEARKLSDVNLHEVAGSNGQSCCLIGLEVTKRTPHVVTLVDNLMDKNGVLQGESGYENSVVFPGDRLMQIDGSQAENVGVQQLRRMLMGARHSLVRLTLARYGSDEKYAIDVLRRNVDLSLGDEDEHSCVAFSPLSTQECTQLPVLAGNVGIEVTKYTPHIVTNIDYLLDKHGVRQGQPGYGNIPVDRGDKLITIDGVRAECVDMKHLNRMLTGEYLTTVEITLSRFFDPESHYTVTLLRHVKCEFQTDVAKNDDEFGKVASAKRVVQHGIQQRGLREWRCVANYDAQKRRHLLEGVMGIISRSSMRLAWEALRLNQRLSICDDQSMALARLVRHNEPVCNEPVWHHTTLQFSSAVALISAPKPCASSKGSKTDEFELRLQIAQSDMFVAANGMQLWAMSCPHCYGVFESPDQMAQHVQRCCYNPDLNTDGWMERWRCEHCTEVFEVFAHAESHERNCSFQGMVI